LFRTTLDFKLRARRLEGAIEGLQLPAPSIQFDQQRDFAAQISGTMGTEM
jgi:hypothetical protein